MAEWSVSFCVSYSFPFCAGLVTEYIDLDCVSYDGCSSLVATQKRMQNPDLASLASFPPVPTSTDTFIEQGLNSCVFLTFHLMSFIVSLIALPNSFVSVVDRPFSDVLHQLRLSLSHLWSFISLTHHTHHIPTTRHTSLHTRTKNATLS